MRENDIIKEKLPFALHEKWSCALKISSANVNKSVNGKLYLFAVLEMKLSLHEKWSFSLKISSVNVSKFAVSFGFGHIYWGNP